MISQEPDNFVSALHEASNQNLQPPWHALVVAASICNELAFACPLSTFELLSQVCGNRQTLGCSRQSRIEACCVAHRWLVYPAGLLCKRVEQFNHRGHPFKRCRAYIKPSKQLVRRGQYHEV